MSKAAGIVVHFSPERQVVFNERLDSDSFAEPVGEFSHSRNVPLICFLKGSSGHVSHIAFGKRGRLAGNDLRRLNISKIFTLRHSVSVSEISQSASSRVKKTLENKLINGGLLPPQSFEEIIEVLGGGACT